MKSDLKRSTIHGIFWSTFERIGQQLVQFVIAIILARMLLPAEFGMIAMLTIFITVGQSLTMGGFGSALIQKQDSTYLDECSIFYFNIFIGFLFAGILFLMAPWIAIFYKIQLLTQLTQVLSLNLIINAFGVIHYTLINKKIDYKLQMKVSVIATLLSGSIGVTMAYLGHGVWSLVAHSISGIIFRTTLLWYFFPWRPSWRFSWISLRSMFPFGSKILFSGLLNTIFNNVYYLVIGKIFSATDLGYYTRAQQLQQLPVDNLTTSVGRVTYPVFSSIQGDNDRLKRGTRKALFALAALNFPLMIGLAVVAEPLVLVLLTDRWLPSVPYIKLLCVASILYPLHAINLNVLLAQGRSDYYFKLEILKKILVIIAIVLTWRWGITAMIYGQIATSVGSYYINCYYTGKTISYPLCQQFKDIFPIICLSLFMGVCVYIAGYIPFDSIIILLIFQISVGLVSYTILSILIYKSSVLEIISYAQGKY